MLVQSKVLTKMFNLTLPDDIRSNKTNLPISIQQELIKQPNLLDDVFAQSSIILFFINHPTYNLPWFIPLSSLTRNIRRKDLEITTIPLSDSKNAELENITLSWFNHALNSRFGPATSYKDTAYLLMVVNKTLIEVELVGVFPTDLEFVGVDNKVDIKLSYDYMIKDVPDYSHTLLAEKLKLIEG